MIKKALFFLPLLALLLFSCKKQQTPDAKFTITAALQNNNYVLLSWPMVKLSGFKNVTIYRSTSPIPDPTFDKQIDGDLQIAIITDNTVTSYLDSIVKPGSNGMVYYKAVINLTDRFIFSNQAQATLSGFSVDLPNNSNSFNNFIVKYLPQSNLLCVLNIGIGVGSVIDYSQKKIIVSNNFPTGTSNSNGVCFVLNNNKPELFLYAGSYIFCFDGLTLNQKYTIPVSANIIDFKVKSGFLYLLSSNYSISTYDLSNQSLVNQQNFPWTSSGSIYSGDIFVGSQTNQIYFKVSRENSYYQQASGGYINSYVNSVVAYNLVNGIPTNYTNLTVPPINSDTTNSNNIYNNQYIQVSPDGNYITCNSNGDIFSLLDHSVHNLRSANNFNPIPLFSYDGKYVLGKTISTSSGMSFNLMDVYNLPGFGLTTSLKSQNTNANSVFIADDFMDNDSLISYNISQSIIGNQAVNSLNVSFKKVD